MYMCNNYIGHHLTISLHESRDIANFPSRSFFCYLAREIFLPREGNHFCDFCVFDFTNDFIIEISLHSVPLLTI